MQKCCLGRRKPTQLYKLRTDCTGSSPAERDLVDLMVYPGVPAAAVAAVKTNSTISREKVSTARKK